MAWVVGGARARAMNVGLGGQAGLDQMLRRQPPDTIDTAGLAWEAVAEIDHLTDRDDRWLLPGAPAAARARALARLARGQAARAAVEEALDDELVRPTHVAWLAWAVSRVGPVAAAERLAAVDLGDGWIVETKGGVTVGHVAATAGLLRLATGDVIGAQQLLRRAVADADGRSPVWAARFRSEWARILLDASDSEDREEGRRQLHVAVLALRAAGWEALARRAHALLDAPQPREVAEPGIGHLVPGPRWLVGYGVVPPRTVRPTRGLAVLRALVAHPDEPIPCAVLASVDDGRIPDRSGGVIHDIESLRDPAARSRVSKLVHRTIDRLGEVHNPLGDHLAASIETGYACRYAPSDPTAWST